MKTFDVYHHPTRGHQAIKQGFCWPAFLFTVFWTMVKGLWGVAIGVFAVMIVLLGIEASFRLEGEEGAALIMVLTQIGVAVTVGVKGNDWRRSNLQQRGFGHLGRFPAGHGDAAIAEAMQAPDRETGPKSGAHT